MTTQLADPPEQNPNIPIAELQGVWIYYDGIPILEDANLTIGEGDFVGVIGPNGGGKTTLLKVLLGLVEPDRGVVRVLGQHPRKTRQWLGYVPQYAQYDRAFPIRVEDVVLMGRLPKRRLLRRYTPEDHQVVAQALERVEMLDLKSRQMSKLSGGQQQRVLIARALASEPKLLLLDEPTASVDNRIGTDLYELMVRLNQDIPIVMVSHDMGAISMYVKQIACVNRTLFYHHSTEITAEVLEAAYQCPIEMIAHGVPHRVLQQHVHTHEEEA